MTLRPSVLPKGETNSPIAAMATIFHLYSLFAGQPAHFKLPLRHGAAIGGNCKHIDSVVATFENKIHNSPTFI